MPLHFRSPADVLALARSDDPQRRELLRDHIRAASDDLRDIELRPTPVQLEDAAVHLSEVTGLLLCPCDVDKLLSLYPRTRLKVARHGINDTDVRDSLGTMVADFFLGTRWPRYGDQVDIDAFLLLITAAGVALGYARAPLPRGPSKTH